MGILQNGDFESTSNTHDVNRWLPGATEPDHTYYDNIVVPRRWVAWWREEFPGPGDPDDPKHATGRPEGKIIGLVPDQKRVRSGVQSACLFTFWRNHDCGYQQPVAVTPGARYQFSIFAHSWHSECDAKPYDPPLDDDCKAMLGDSHDWISVGIDPNGGIDPFAVSVVWSAPGESYGTWKEFSVEAVAAGPQITVFTRAQTIWPLKHSDTYWDDAKLVEIAHPEPPEPPEECRGTPRTQYRRVFNVIPATANDERAAEIFMEGWKRGHETSGGSYDDAGVGDLDERIARLYDVPEREKSIYQAFYAEWYPGTRVSFAGGEPEPPIPPDDILLWQCDPRWANLHHGGPTCTTTICSDGCFDTCLAMAQRWYGIKVDATPITVQEAIGPDGYAVCKTTWAAINTKLGMTISSGTEVQVRAHLDAGGVALAEVIPGDDMHFVMVYDYSAASNLYWMYDPWKNVDAPLTEFYPNGAQSWRILTKQGEPPEPPVTVNGRAASVHAQVWGPTPQVMGYKPSCYKRITGCQDLLTARLLNPNMVAVYRAEQSWVSPAQWVADSADTLHQVADAMEAAGLPPVYGKQFWMEARNEVYSSSDHAALLYWRDQEIEIIHEMERVEPRVGVVAFCAPVGNPNEWEYPDLVPLARECEQHGGLMGYHAYWFGNQTQQGMTDEHWPWLQGRWAMMDDVFTAAGVHCRWFFGETGVVGGTWYPGSAMSEDRLMAMEAGEWEPGHWHDANQVYVDANKISTNGTLASLTAAGSGGSYALLPNDGWKSPACLDGNLTRYVDETGEFLDRTWTWNLTHGGRAVGGVLFTSGANYTGWDSFQVQGPEWAQIGAMMLARWPLPDPIAREWTTPTEDAAWQDL